MTSSASQADTRTGHAGQLRRGGRGGALRGHGVPARRLRGVAARLRGAVGQSPDEVASVGTDEADFFGIADVLGATSVTRPLHRAAVEGCSGESTI